MAAPDSSPVLPEGTVVLGKLRVVRMLGAGGMGAVYEVEHEITKHRRALKVLHPRVARQPGVMERFLREASAAGRIGSPHVVETFDAGQLDGGEPYLLMELIDGETLDRRVERLGPLPPGEVADLVFQACQGVQAAHDAGIVHRDLKPENLIVTTRDGAPFVKVLDFGISQFDADQTGTLRITADGLVMGTPYYMSPEQVRGTATDARTDIYALGVILYECSCGVRPFDARSVEVLAVLIHEGKPTPLRERRPSLPDDFCAIVHCAMAADRDRRFASARGLGEALAPLRVRTLHAPPRSSDLPPRAVIRPSQRPPGVSDGAPVSSVVPSTEAGLAATMGAPGGRRGRSARTLGLVAGVLFLGAVGTAVVARSLRTPNAPEPQRSGAAVAPPPPSVELDVLALPSASAIGSPVERLVSASASASVQPSAPPTPPNATYPTIAPPGTQTPATPPPPRSRVDQTGLAGENPFR